MIKVSETLTERIYEIKEKPGWQVVSTQLPGKAETNFSLRGAPGGAWFLYGTQPSCLAASTQDGSGAVSSDGFPPGTDVWLQLFEADSKPATPLIMFRSICRYPYGRVFTDFIDEVIQQPFQSRSLDYDLVYYTTEASLDPVRKRVLGTDANLYMDHILASILTDGMSEMEKAKAIWMFISQAIQHNGIQVNLKETVAALDAFWEDPAGDFDELTMLILELGYTRCGVINGFMSASLLKRVGIKSTVTFACGGHTGGVATIEGKDRVWDPDAYKHGIPLDDNGDIPEYEWARLPENQFVLDTVPSWSDTLAHEGWNTTREGFRMSGYVDGARFHSETGYASSWHGAPKAYPPRPPELIPVLWRNEGLVRLEWYGSYARDGNFRDYLVQIFKPDGSIYKEQETEKPYLELELPQTEGYSFTVQARDWYAKGTPYFGRIDYTTLPAEPIPVKNIEFPYPWDLLGETDTKNRINLLEGVSPLEFIEGRDNFLGETRVAQTNLWRTECGRTEKPIFRMVDETNRKFSRVSIRSLFARDLPKPLTNADGWHFTAVMRINLFDVAGYGKFPMVWLGRRNGHVGVGIGMDCEKGLICAALNIMGDWRYSNGFDPSGFVRFDIVCEKGVKRLNFYANGQLFSVQDYSMFREGSFDVDKLFISGNPEAETGYLVSDLLI